MITSSPLASRTYFMCLWLSSLTGMICFTDDQECWKSCSKGSILCKPSVVDRECQQASRKLGGERARRFPIQWIETSKNGQPHFASHLVSTWTRPKDVLLETTPLEASPHLSPQAGDTPSPSLYLHSWLHSPRLLALSSNSRSTNRLHFDLEG